MPSLISQMRNEAWPQQQMPQQQASRAQYNQSIEQVRSMMMQIKNAENPQVMLAQILQNNPNTAAISGMLQNGGSLEGIARSMAKQRGVNIEQLINQLQGGL